ncbi:MAG: cache domain-containing protein [Peptococcaceae bacterium]|nr:cache domain-containing protein [Peptococcaceae bacterium]
MFKKTAWKRDKLLVQISISLIMLIPIALLAYHLFYDDVQKGRAAEEAKNLQTAALTANYLDNFLDQITNSLSSAAGSGAIRRGDIEQIRTLLTDLHLSNPEVASFFLSDTQGNLLTTIPEQKPTPNIASRDYFAQALQGKGYISGPYRGLMSGEQIVICSVPYFQQNRVGGLIGATIPLSELTKKMSLIQPNDSSNFILLTRNGQFLTDPVPPLNLSLHDPTFQALFNGKSDSLVFTSPSTHSLELLSYVNLGKVPWIVGVIQPLAQWEAQQQHDLLLNGFLLFLVVLFVFTASHYVKLYRDRLEAEQVQKAEKLSLVGQLAAGMAHEIRNPLTAIKGFIQLIQSNKNQPVPELYLDTVLSELERIELIVSEMMVLAKPSPAKFIQVDLGQLISAVVNLLEPQARLKFAVINLTSQADLPLLEAQPNQLKQVFINLIKNSIESIPEQGTIDIDIKQKTPASLIVTITDNGIGIPAANIEKLGTPFFSTKDSGTGLGLMVSYRIIQNHQGEISVVSVPDYSTTFTLVLPLQQK